MALNGPCAELSGLRAGAGGLRAELVVAAAHTGVMFAGWWGMALLGGLLGVQRGA